MITLYGRKTSANVQIVMWGLAELGLDYEQIEKGGAFGGLDDPQFLAINPHGLVPALVDGAAKIFESAAILRYLTSKYGKAPYSPQDESTHALADAWGEWSKNTVAAKFLSGVFVPVVRTAPSARNWPLIDANLAALEKDLAIVDARLGKHPYLVGDDITFADGLFAHILYRYFTLPIVRADLPNLRRYYFRLTVHKAYQDNVMIDYTAMQIQDPAHA